MPHLIDSVADLTGHRDRDTLEVSVCAALRDLLDATMVAAYKFMTLGATEHVHLRARVRQGEARPFCDPYGDPETMPKLAEHPELAACAANNVCVRIPQDKEGAFGYLFPIANGTSVFGLLKLHLARALTAEDERLVLGFSRIYRNHLAILDDSEHDTLTGLFNRKIYDETFIKLQSPSTQNYDPEEFSIGHRQPPGPEHVRWLVVVDIDHFKRINDQFGHLYGDEVLLLLARIMRKSFRNRDILFRFGGEEFVILLDLTKPADATTVLERFRATVERYAFPQISRVTVSMGYSEIQPRDSPAGAFDRADAALYYAKQNGRNRVCYHEQLVGDGLLEEKSVQSQEIELF